MIQFKMAVGTVERINGHIHFQGVRLDGGEEFAVPFCVYHGTPNYIAVTPMETLIRDAETERPFVAHEYMRAGGLDDEPDVLVLKDPRPQ